ncbi:hypothetical protein DsansV1_C06g0062941 [Dioscorea sansibarensis]
MPSQSGFDQCVAAIFMHQTLGSLNRGNRYLSMVGFVNLVLGFPERDFMWPHKICFQFYCCRLQRLFFQRGLCLSPDEACLPNLVLICVSPLFSYVRLQLFLAAKSEFPYL